MAGRLWDPRWRRALAVLPESIPRCLAPSSRSRTTRAPKDPLPVGFHVSTTSAPIASVLRPEELDRRGELASFVAAPRCSLPALSC